MEAVDVGIRQPGPRLMVVGEENVLFESSGGGSDEADGGHDWFELLVGHNRLEGSRVPQGQFPHTFLHRVSVGIIVMLSLFHNQTASSFALLLSFIHQTAIGIFSR